MNSQKKAAGRYTEPLSSAEAAMLRSADNTSIFPLKDGRGIKCRWDFLSRRTGQLVATWFSRGSHELRGAQGSELGRADHPKEALRIAIREEQREKE